MRRSTRRRLRLLIGLVLASALVGVLYGGAIGHVFRETGLVGGAIGAIDGIMISVPIATFEIFGLRTRWGGALQRTPFMVTFGLKWLVYGALISLVNLRSPGVRLVGLVAFTAPLPGSVALASVVFSFAMAFAFLFVVQVSQMVGLRTLGHILFGRYHRPHLEDRFFLFVDIRGSTLLAERIGPAGVHRFLATVFRLASDPIGDHRGEIYQYVGDEMVVTWTLAAGRQDARPLACFYAIEAALEDAGPVFEREFGAAPRLRAALHAGPVISGEIGDTKREIVFHGDVMNTAARLEEATRDLDRQFLVSAEALERLEGAERYARELLGPHPLRGRAAPVEICAITNDRKERAYA